MTRKRMITKFAKEIRQETGHTFIESIKLAKHFLKGYYHKVDSFESEKLGFVYEFDSHPDYTYEESFVFKGAIKSKIYPFKEYEIPLKYYEMKDKFF